jgi:putative flippase GtrA
MLKKILAHRIAQNQVLRFVFSAGIGFLVDISTFHLFYHNIFEKKTYQVISFTLGNYTLSLAVSFFLGVVVNFLITRYIVFYQSKSRPSKQFFRFVLVAIIGYFANLAIVRFLIEQIHVNPDLARITAALSLFFASYFIHKLFSFSLSLRHHAT